MAIAIPITPGKFAEWRHFVDELNGSRRADFVASRRNVGLHERTFLQRTPMGDFAVVTVEGNDPAGSFQRMVASNDAFTKWFLGQVQDVHSVDLRQAAAAPMPELISDTEA